MVDPDPAAALTPRQRELLEFISRSQDPPTVRELAATFGIARTTVHGHIETLRRKGFLPASTYKRRAGVRRSRPLRGLPTREPATPKEAFHAIICGLEHLMQRPLEDWEVDAVLSELRIALPALAG
jgi:DNA-binding FadR family transcriptional regulator